MQTIHNGIFCTCAEPKLKVRIQSHINPLVVNSLKLELKIGCEVCSNGYTLLSPHDATAGDLNHTVYPKGLTSLPNLEYPSILNLNGEAWCLCGAFTPKYIKLDVYSRGNTSLAVFEVACATCPAIYKLSWYIPRPDYTKPEQGVSNA